MIKASFKKKIFNFKVPSGTSRGILTEKHAWFLSVWDEESPQTIGVGECSIIPGLSPDFISFADYEQQLSKLCRNLSIDLANWPSLKFGLETALLDLNSRGNQIYFDNDFHKGKLKIPINGLIWMGSEGFMQDQIDEKIAAGFKTIKMKIGSIDFETEFKLLSRIREKYSKEELTVRVDANGSFSPEAAIEKLTLLESIDIHSIEQPIAAGQYKKMQELCSLSPLKIALDEELIGVNTLEEKIKLLDTIKPPYIILKPSLHGGISGCKEWIKLAEKRDIAWWITSALESNIGLNAICQFTAEYNNQLPQGLGTGSLYTDNIPSDLTVENGYIFVNKH